MYANRFSISCVKFLKVLLKKHFTNLWLLLIVHANELNAISSSLYKPYFFITVILLFSSRWLNFERLFERIYSWPYGNWSQIWDFPISIQFRSHYKTLAKKSISLYNYLSSPNMNIYYSMHIINAQKPAEFCTILTDIQMPTYRQHF